MGRPFVQIKKGFSCVLFEQNMAKKMHVKVWN
jgi:hypothetical protein